MYYTGLKAEGYIGFAHTFYGRDMIVGWVFKNPLKNDAVF